MTQPNFEKQILKKRLYTSLSFFQTYQLCLPIFQSGIHVCYAGFIRRGERNSWRSGAAAWRKDRNSWRSGAVAGVAEGSGAQRRKFLVLRWHTS